MFACAPQPNRMQVLSGLTNIATQGSGADSNTYRVLEADFGPAFSAFTSSSGLKLLAANPSDGCLSFAHTTNYVGAVVLIQRNNCTFQDKARLLAGCLCSGCQPRVTATGYGRRMARLALGSG